MWAKIEILLLLMQDNNFRLCKTLVASLKED